MEDQIISAIQIAWDPASDQGLKRQAFGFVNQLRQAPEAWQPCLSIFTHIPRHSEVVRVFSLEIVNNAVQAGLVDVQGLQMVKEHLMTYLRRAYGSQTAESVPDSAGIENKIAQTITFLFSAFYANGWEACITDLLDLTKSSSGTSDNLLGTVFYLRVLNSIHDEIGDQLVSRSRQEQDRANTLKDLLRERDVQKVVLSWQEILNVLGTQNPVVAELCLKAIGKWVSWIDIGLVVNQNMMQLLFQQLELAQREELNSSEEKARDAVIDVFTETIGKKMSPTDKINMMSFLDLENVVSRLVSCPRLSANRGSSTYDVDLAETVAKLVNGTVQDIVRALETETQNSDTWQKAEKMLRSFLMHLLRFFSDEYDEVCSTVLTAMTDVLTFLRKATQGDEYSTQRAAMLLPILNAIFAKMRYDETANWGDDDERTDEAEFQDLRKRLGALQQAVAVADEQLYTDAVSGLVMNTFESLQKQPGQVDWRDLDLALHEMYLLGDLAIKNGGLYQKDKPNSPAAERLIRMMLMMVQANVGSYNHPAIQVQYMEICVRYSAFFNKQGDYVRQVLDNFLLSAHHSNIKVKTRAWYLLQRFTRQQRQNAGRSAEALVSRLQDLLVVKAESPNQDAEDEMSSENESSGDSMFTSQLYLFEAVGCVIGAPDVSAEDQVRFVQITMQPIFIDVERNLTIAKSNDEQAISQVHHDIMALGNIARGYHQWSGNPVSNNLNAPDLVKEAFARISEVTLVALESLKESFEIRTAARFAFSRLIGIVGQQMMQQLPRWVEGLLTESSSRDEMAQFLRLLDQVTFGFKNDIFNFLDSLFSGLLQRVFAGISAATSGTDDEIELAELKREYLNFLLVILGNDLGGVLVSTTNQSIFESVISTIEHFAKDAEDFPTAKMAFQLLNRMCNIWGGPDIIVASALAGGTPTAPTATTQTALPGFSQFMMQRFSPLCWALPLNSAFNAKDAQARQVLIEAAGLQKTIHAKTGDEYLTWLRDNELKGLVGMNDAMAESFMTQFVNLDMKGWRQFFPKFISQGGQA